MLRYYSHQLVPGSVEHKEARVLVQKFEAKIDIDAVVE